MSEERPAGEPAPDEAAQIDPEQYLRDVIAPGFSRRIEELRSQIESLRAQLTEHESVAVSIRLDLRGEGGGTWYMNVQEGRMGIAGAPTSAVLFSIQQEADDWKSLVGRGAFLGTGSRALTASRVGRLRAISGTVRLVVRSNEAASGRSILLHFGEGDAAAEPHATVLVHEDDAAKLREGTIDPQTAFLQGLVKIEGDMALAIQLGTALFL